MLKSVFVESSSEPIDLSAILLCAIAVRDTIRGTVVSTKKVSGFDGKGFVLFAASYTVALRKCKQSSCA